MRQIFQAWISVCDRRQSPCTRILSIIYVGSCSSKGTSDQKCILLHCACIWTWSIYGFPLKNKTKKNTCFALVFRLLFFFFRIELDKSQAHVRNTCISHSKEIRPNYHQTIRAINQLNLFKFVLAKSRVALEEEFKGDFLISIHCMHVVM